MAYRLISLLFLTGCSLNYIHGQCLTENDKQTAMKKETVDNLSDARFEFAIESLKKIIEIDSNENIFYSPHSLYEAITLVFFGSRRHTEVSLKKALRIPQELTKADVQRFYSYEKTYEESRKANSTNNYDFRVANRLWFSKDKKLRDCMVEFFQNELRQVDFKANPDAIRVQINDWVSDVTKGNIRDFLPVNSLDESTDTVLANAVYFKGFWQSRFQPENTKRDVFYLGQDNMTIIPFMKQKGTFNHMISEELGAHILQLPYKGDDVSMYILLPPFVSNRAPDSEPREPNVGLRQLLHRITSTEAGARELRDILDNGMPARDVELSIPRFSMEKDLPVKQLLSAMGASQVIEPDISDLSGFVADGERSPYLGDAVHRAKIELNEEGTTAAAATALFSFRSSRPTEPAHFNANHPFAYFIYDKSTKTLLFAGVFRKPTGKH